MESKELLTGEETETPEPSRTSKGNPLVTPQEGAASCPTCGGWPQMSRTVQAPAYVYSICCVQPRFPLLSVEKEFAQVVGRSETARLTDRETFHAVLSKPENRYLARQLCWVASIKGLDTYILQARASLHFDFLIETVRPRPSPMDLDIVIGALGELAPPEMCNGLVVPIVYLDQMYSFDRETLLKSVPKPEKPIDTKFEAIAEEILERILQMADNAGSTDEHRALNYLSVRCPTIYAETAKAFARNSILSSIEVRRSPLSGTRRIVDVIFSYTNRATDVTEKVFTRVDVTEKFPFLVTKPSPYVEQYGR